jgi:cysteinyl-tRNA synthetase
MNLRLYDTLTRDKRPFAPLDPNNVRMYVCGPTVYDFAHIGNARPVIVFDVLFRLLRHLYGADHVTYVRNITDVDDKINDRAARDFPGLPLNEAIRKVTEQTEKQFHDDVDALGCFRPTVEPRATEHIAEMRTIIEKLVAGGFAYVAEDHVLFSPQAMNAANSVLPRYGALANRSLDEMIAGARVDVAPYKRDATDFVLWKPSKPGEPSWPSPSGIKVEGRPGWHIECSAMAWKHLGEQFDIHGGGIDLVFPHHENELAQSCCAFHEARMANVWMHNGFLQVEGEKMSKSLGNFVTIRELLADWPGKALRLNMLKTHYRSPIDWTNASLDESYSELRRWAVVLRVGLDARQEQSRPSEELVAALSDDINTPSALAVMRQNFSRASNDNDESAKRILQTDAKFLGLLDRESILQLACPIQWKVQPTDNVFGLVKRFRASLLNGGTGPMESSGVQVRFNGEAFEVTSVLGTEGDFSIDRLVSERLAARKARNFAESDRIRDKLAAMHVVLKDGKDADGNLVTTWEIAR